MGVTVTFIAILELMKEGLVEIVQAEAYAPIHLRPASSSRHLTVVGGSDMDADAENEAALAQPAYPDEDSEDDAEDAPTSVPNDTMTATLESDSLQTEHTVADHGPAKGERGSE
jgi:segregation and condensation protein A